MTTPHSVPPGSEPPFGPSALGQPNGSVADLVKLTAPETEEAWPAARVVLSPIVTPPILWLFVLVIGRIAQVVAKGACRKARGVPGRAARTPTERPVARPGLRVGR